MSKQKFNQDFWELLSKKKWWVTPILILIVILIVGIIIMLNPELTPFVYERF